MALKQGFFGNYTEVDLQQLYAEYSNYLMQDEKIVSGFKLVRDVMIITDKRILEFDKQGATGQKMRVKSIYLNSIFNVSAETAGFGVDDSELEICYISTPYLKAHGVQYSSKSFEFPKKFDITPLYKMFQELAYKNYIELNK